MDLWYVVLNQSLYIKILYVINIEIIFVKIFNWSSAGVCLH